jgi:hypothetical protein
MTLFTRRTIQRQTRSVQAENYLGAYTNPMAKATPNYFNPLSEDAEQKLHDLFYNGAAFGRDKLYSLFRQKYPNVPASRRAVWDFLSKSELHQIYQRPNVRRSTIRPILAGKVGSCQMDTKLMLSDAYQGYNAAHTCVDIFSMKLYVYPCKNPNSTTACNALRHFLDSGMKCSVLAVDQGSEFKGQFPELCKERGITLFHAQSHSPWQQGKIEGRHGYWARILHMTMRAKGTKDWPSVSQLVLDQLNNTRVLPAKQTPNEIERGDADLQAGVVSAQAARAARRYRNQTSPDLEVGQHARKMQDYESTGLKKKAKHGFWSTEIYKISATVKSRKYQYVNTSYKLTDLEGKPVQGSFARWQILPIPDPDEMKKIPETVHHPGPVGEEDEYEVESLLDKHVDRRGKVTWKVKWRGWARPTWEKAENLTGSQDLIDEYEAAHPTV